MVCSTTVVSIGSLCQMMQDQNVEHQEAITKEKATVGNSKTDYNIGDSGASNDESSSDQASNGDDSEYSDNDDGNDGILSSLTKRDIVNALIVVLISTSLALLFGGVHFLKSSTSSNEGGVMKSTAALLDGPLYKRTWGIKFCLPSRPLDLPVESVLRHKPLFCTSSLIKPASEEEKDAFEERQHWDAPQMKRVNFSVPREFIPSLLSFFQEDYPLSYKSLHVDPALLYATNPIPFYTQGATSELVPVKVYLEPSVDTFYKNEEDRKIIIKNQQDNQKKKTQNLLEDISKNLLSSDIIQAVEPTFNGFASKIVNLSHKPVDLYWDGGYEDSEGKNVKKSLKIATISPFEAAGTATFPGHQFYITPTYDSDDAIDRFILSPEEPIHVFNPFENPPPGSGVTAYKLDRLSSAQKRQYERQKLNVLFSTWYQTQTARPWYGMFPRPPPIYHMWSADYFGQTHTIQTTQTYYQKLPPRKMLKPMTMMDMEQRHDEHHVSYRSNNAELLPLNLTVISCRPRVFEIRNFLSTVEVNHLLSIASKSKLEESTVSAGDTGDTYEKMKYNQARSSSNTWIYREESPIVDTIYRRAAAVMNIDEKYMRDRLFDYNTDDPVKSSRAEALQLVHYDVGQHYTPHHDFTFPSSLNSYQPTRFVTLLLYLNDEGLEGGETAFPKGVNAESPSGLMVTPEMGKAVLFYNMLPDGNMDDLSQHASLPVRKGEKWLANLWVWDAVNVH